MHHNSVLCQLCSTIRTTLNIEDGLLIAVKEVARCEWRCCVIRARGEPGREAHPPQYTRSDRGIPSSAIRFSTAHLIAASTFWFLTVRAERLTPSIALYRETAFSATLWRVQPLDFRHS